MFGSIFISIIELKSTLFIGSEIYIKIIFWLLVVFALLKYNFCREKKSSWNT